MCAPKEGPAPTCVHTARPRKAHKERQARNMQPDSNTQMAGRLFPVGAQHAVPGAAIPGLRPHARLRSLAPFVASFGTRPEPIRSAHSITISNRNIPELEPHLTVAISTNDSFLIATKRANRTFVFFLAAAQQRHLKSATHYAYLSRHTFERRSARPARRERAAGVFGMKHQNSNRRKTGT